MPRGRWPIAYGRGVSDATVTDPDCGPDPEPECELCQAAGLTERFYADDDCWIAECESCFVPMIVWRHHVVEPPAAIRGRLRECLSDVVAQHFDGAFWIDENMRSIPTHYHAHARPKHGVGASGFRRRSRHEQPSATTSPQ